MPLTQEQRQKLQSAGYSDAKIKAYEIKRFGTSYKEGGESKSFAQKALDAGTRVSNALGLQKATDILGTNLAINMANSQQEKNILARQLPDKASEVAGAGLQVASVLAPGGAPKTLVGQVLAGAGAGYAQDVGSAFAQGEDAPEALQPGVGTVVGAAAPAALVGLARGAGATASVAKNLVAPRVQALGELTAPVTQKIAGAADRLLPKTPEQKILRTIESRKGDFIEVIEGRKKTIELFDSIKDRFDDFDVVEFLSSDDRFKPTVNKDGKIFTVRNIQELDKIVNEEAPILRQAIEAEGKAIPLDVFKKRALDAIKKYRNQGSIYETYKNRINADFETYKNFIDEQGRIPLSVIDDIKKAKYEIVDYNNPENKIADREIASVAKDLIETLTDNADVRAFNNELAKLYSARDLLDAMNGATVKGGRMGKYFAGQVGSLSGTVAGMTVGGPLGAIGGGAMGQAVGEMAQGALLSNKFKGVTGNLRKIPGVVEDTVKNLKETKLLQSPNLRQSTNTVTPSTANTNAPITSTVPPKSSQSNTNKSVFAAATGFEQDEEGGITFDPLKGALGVGVAGSLGKVLPPKKLASIASRVDEQDLKLMEYYIDGVRLRKFLKPKWRHEVVRMAENMKLDSLGTRDLTKAFEKIYEAARRGRR